MNFPAPCKMPSPGRGRRVAKFQWRMRPEHLKVCFPPPPRCYKRRMSPPSPTQLMKRVCTAKFKHCKDSPLPFHHLAPFPGKAFPILLLLFLSTWTYTSLRRERNRAMGGEGETPLSTKPGARIKIESVLSLDSLPGATPPASMGRGP